MNYEKPNKIILFLSIILIITNLYLSYAFSGRSVTYVISNVFGFTMIVITISSFFTKYRNSRSRWIITLNTMVITFLMLVSNIFIRTAEEVGYKHMNEVNQTVLLSCPKLQKSQEKPSISLKDSDSYNESTKERTCEQAEF